MECLCDCGAGSNFDNRFKMSKHLGLAPLLCSCSLLTVACLAVVGHAADSQGFLAQVLHGREVFERNCMECHGADGKGTGQLAAALPVRPADLTDCKLTDEDPVLTGQGIIRHGGSYNGRSAVMPGFGTVLSSSDIADVARYVRTLCADPHWVTRELDFPHPLITSKAFPEQHITVGGRFGRNGTTISEYMGTLDYRVNGLTSIVIMARGLSINPNIGSTESGLGDTVLSVNRDLAFSTQYRALASASLGLTCRPGTTGGDWGMERLCSSQAIVRVWIENKSFLPEPAFANHPDDRIQYGYRDIRIVVPRDEKRDSSSPSG